MQVQKLNSYSMKFTFLSVFIAGLLIAGCSSTKKIKTGAANIDGAHAPRPMAEEDSLAVNQLLYAKNDIPFNTFSAKVKVNYEDASGKQPEVNAFVRMKKGEAIWISVAATFLNIEAYRILITPDSIVILNKMEKTIEQYPISYIQDRLSIPVNFKDAERLIAGKAILAGDSVQSVSHMGEFIQAIVSLPNVYNRIYFTEEHLLLAKQMISVSQLGDHFTANLLYEDYEKTKDGGLFSVTRNITIPEKNQKLQLTFRQYEFNKELSLPFTKPEGYDLK